MNELTDIETLRKSCPGCMPDASYRYDTGVTGEQVLVAIVRHARGCPWFAEKCDGTDATIVTGGGILIHCRQDN